MPPCAGGVGVGDEWPKQVRVYDYVLAYKFTLKEAADGVSVRFPSLNAQLYESPYEAQLWAIFDAHKQLMRFGDYYPEPVKLQAGDYEVRLQLRHESPAYLERLKDVPLVLELPLVAPLKLEFHWSRAGCLQDPQLGPKPPARQILDPGTRVALFVSCAAPPAVAEPGDTLVGTATYAKLAVEAVGAGKRPGGWPVTLVVPPPPKPAAADEAAKAEAAKAEAAKEAKEAKPDEASERALEAAVRALRIQQLATLTAKIKQARGPAAATAAAAAIAAAAVTTNGADAANGAAAAGDAPPQERYDALLVRLRAECAAAPAPTEAEVAPLLPLLQAHLAHVEALAARDDAAALRRLVAVADEVAAAIDATALAAAFGTTLDKEDKAAARRREADDTRKKALVGALAARATALADLHALAAPNASTGGATSLAELDAALAALHRWAPPAEHWKLLVSWHRAHGRCATALVALEEHLNLKATKDKGPPPREKLELRASLLEALGWAHWAANARALLALKFPAAYPPPYV